MRLARRMARAPAYAAVRRRDLDAVTETPARYFSLNGAPPSMLNSGVRMPVEPGLVMRGERLVALQHVLFACCMLCWCTSMNPPAFASGLDRTKSGGPCGGVTCSMSCSKLIVCPSLVATDDLESCFAARAANFGVVVTCHRFGLRLARSVPKW